MLYSSFTDKKSEFFSSKKRLHKCRHLWFLTKNQHNIRAFLVAQTAKNPLAMWETWVQFLGWEDPLRRAWQPAPVFLPGESLWTVEPGGLQSSKELDVTEWLNIQIILPQIKIFKWWMILKKIKIPMDLDGSWKDNREHNDNCFIRRKKKKNLWECYLWVNTNFAQISAHYILHFYKSKWQEIKPIYFFTQISGKLTEPVWIHTSRTWKKNMVKKSESHSVVSDSWIL